MPESSYYETVAQWLTKDGGCFHAGKNRGKKLARPDVVGIRHTGEDLAPDYELVAVEVKTDEPFFRSISQAAGYSVFAHRCYLADVEHGKNRFTRTELEIAQSLGVGLLKIRSRHTVIECLSAPRRQAQRRFVLQMLESIGASECVLCKGVFMGTYKTNVKRADRQDVLKMVKKAIKNTGNGQPTGYLFWSTAAAEMKAAAGDNKANSARRYLCPDCLTNILGPLIQDER